MDVRSRFNDIHAHVIYFMIGAEYKFFYKLFVIVTFSTIILLITSTIGLGNAIMQLFSSTSVH